MRKLIAGAIFLCLFTVMAFAQQTGSLTGSVTDSNGSVIPGATLTILDNQTNKERVIQVGSDGTFNLPQLFVGDYTVKVSATGFKTQVYNDVKIDVSRPYTLNVVLEPGNVSEEVSVIAGADVVNATTGEIGATISTKQIRELPINGRDPTALISTQAGTTSNGATNLTINGQRTSFTNITRDGINIQDNFIRSNASTFAVERPTIDDVSEFSVITQNAAAEQGYGASQIQFVTPRGQNEFHGALFFYNRNSKFAANDWENNKEDVPIEFLNRNQVGGRLSGPIIKNKLFFFFSTEFFFLRNQSTRTRTVLTPLARQGMFRYTRSDNGQVQTVNIFGITPGQNPGANAPTGIDSIVASRLLANVPLPNSSGGDGFNTGVYTFNQRNNLDRKNIPTFRIDYDVNDRNVINGVFSFTRENPNDRPDVDGSQGFTTVPVVNQPADRKFISVAWNSSITPSLHNEVRGGFFTSDPIFTPTTPRPNFFIIPSVISNPEVTFEEQGRTADVLSFQDTARWTKGRHTLTFGGQAQIFKVDAFASFSSIPRFTLGTNTNTPAFTTAQFTDGTFPGGVPTTFRGTANGLYSLLGGIVTGGTQEFNVTSRDSGFVAGAPSRNIFRYETYGFYVQDQWRVSPTLTLNLGLRYDLYTPLRETRGLALEPVIGSGDPVQAILNPNGMIDFIGANGGGKRFYQTDKNNFGPILSFAWQPRFENGFFRTLFGENKTVIRGGYRISYVNDEFVRAPDNAQGGNQGLNTTLNAVVNGTTSLNARLNALPTINPPAMVNIPRSYAAGNGPANNFFGTVFAVDPNLKSPATYEYSFGIQREIGRNNAFEIRYVGGYSKNLVRGIDFNQIDIRGTGFLADFIRARNNIVISGGSATCNLPGCQPLTVFPNLAFGGLLTNGTVLGQIRNGTPGNLAFIYIINGLEGTVQFRPNPNAGVADLLTNAGRYNYNSLQAEFRRRFSRGLEFFANYTFQKTLTNASGVGQTNFEPNLDNLQPQLEYSRADYDQTHVFNAVLIYELPFGKGKRFLNQGGFVNQALGGWQISSIFRVSTGAPISILDASRGTINRGGRESRQTASSSLTPDQIKGRIGIFSFPGCNTLFFIDPTLLNITVNANGTCVSRATSGPDVLSAPQNGQVFFHAQPGQTGNLPRAFLNGPDFFNWDFGLAKNFSLGKLREGMRLQIRADAFNLLNRPNFFTGSLNINSNSFGQIGSTFSPRIVQFAARIDF